MNEQIHELISSYLSGGNTPEQDRELFEACSKRPETAELLRSHLMLSLKLRSLREQTEVPADVRNSLLLRVNELQAERERHSVHESPPRERVNRFGWAHILGSTIATAAAAAALFMLLPESTPPTSTALQAVDTVRIVQRDTIVQTRDITRPVYITRVIREKPVIDIENLVDTSPPSDNRESDATVTVPIIAPVLENVSHAEAIPVKEQLRQAKVNQYLDQYNSMLASVETVQLTSRDRISQ